MKNILLISNRADKYGPIARSLIVGAKEIGVDIGFIEDNPQGYDNAVVFTNQVQLLPKINARIGWYMADLRSPDILPDIDIKIDKIFLCNTEYLSEYSAKYDCDTLFVPQCGIDFKSKAKIDIKEDIVFIGNLINTKYHANRSGILKKVSDNFKLKIITGEHYTESSPYIYKNTPISLAISPPMKHYTSNRLYNIISSGGFCVTNYFEGIEDLFTHGKHLVWYRTDDELLELIDYYLKYEEERKEIAKNGQELYRKQFTAKNHLTTMFNSLQKQYD